MKMITRDEFIKLTLKYNITPCNVKKVKKFYWYKKGKVDEYIIINSKTMKNKIINWFLYTWDGCYWLGVAVGVFATLVLVCILISDGILKII